MNFNYFLLTAFVVFTFQKDNHISATDAITKARIESCPGCQLNRLLEVKKFIYEDVPKYSNVEFKKIQGAPPELVFLSEQDEEIERISLKDFTRQQCNELLQKKGFLMEKADREL